MTITFSYVLFCSVFLSEGLYMETSQVAENENGGLAHMKDTKVIIDSIEVVWISIKRYNINVNNNGSGKTA